MLNSTHSWYGQSPEHPPLNQGRSGKGETKLAEKRKQYSPEFKFKVVLESLQRDTTMEAVCRKFGVSCSMVSRWRHAFQQRGPEVFAEQRGLNGKAKLQRYEPGESSDELKKLIGELIVQNEVLKKSRRLPGDNL